MTIIIYSYYVQISRSLSSLLSRLLPLVQTSIVLLSLSLERADWGDKLLGFSSEEETLESYDSEKDDSSKLHLLSFTKW